MQIVVNLLFKFFLIFSVLRARQILLCLTLDDFTREMGAASSDEGLKSYLQANDITSPLGRSSARSRLGRETWPREISRGHFFLCPSSPRAQPTERRKTTLLVVKQMATIRASYTYIPQLCS